MCRTISQIKTHLIIFFLLQMTVRMKSLKQHLTDAESQLSSLQEEKTNLEADLRDQVDENYQLKQTLASMR